MFKHLPILITILVAAMLFGLVGHGFELFYPIEGENWYGAIKAFGFPLAIECSSSVGLYVGFSRLTRGKLTRLVALGIGLFSLITSFIVQFHYFRDRIEYDGWYSAVLPGLVALLSALAGLLDREQSGETGNITQYTEERNLRGIAEEKREAFAGKGEPKLPYLAEIPEPELNNAADSGSEAKFFTSPIKKPQTETLRPEREQGITEPNFPIRFSSLPEVKNIIEKEMGAELESESFASNLVNFAEYTGEVPVTSEEPDEAKLVSLLEKVSTTLEKSDPRQKWLEALRLNRLEGRSFKEIGAKLGVSDRSASKWCQWGLQVLEGKK